MGIDLGRIQVIVPQYLLQSPHINAVLQHQRSRCVPELVGGIHTGIQSGSGKTLFYHIVYRVRCHTGMASCDKESVFVNNTLSAPNSQPIVNGLPTGFVEEQNPLFVTLA